MESLETLLNVVKTALGVGGLILIHELGHFLVGRWSGIRAEVFSICFGQALLRWKPGETEYRLAWLPLGGYVRFAGETDVDTHPDRAAPGTFNAASYTGKMATMAAGVVMNLLLAVALYAVAFGMGVEAPAPVVGSVRPGSTAWEYGLQRGDRLLTIDGDVLHSFEDVPQKVAVAERVQVELERDGERIELELPTQESEGGLRVIGVGIASSPENDLVVTDDSPAFEAGFRTGDRLRTVDGEPAADLFVAIERHARANRPLPWTVERDGETLEFQMPLVGKTAWAIGVLLDSTTVDVVRRGSPAWTAGLRAGDQPLRLGSVPTPTTASAQQALRNSIDGPLVVRRGGNEVVLELPTDADGRSAFADGFVGRTDPSDLLVSPSPPVGTDESPAAAAGLTAGSTLTAADGETLATFDDLRRVVAAAAGEPLELTWRTAEGDERTATVLPHEFVEWSAATAGVSAAMMIETFQAEHLGEALWLGLRRTGSQIGGIVDTLGSMLTGGVSARQLSGPVAIARVSYAKAEQGLPAFFVFLGFISVNLAVLNLLPIPVLDGGRMVELTIEQVRGEPLSPRIKEWIAISGFVLIVGLMLFVVGNDLLKL